MQRLGLALLLGSVATVVLFSGCGKKDGLERVIVSGTITYNGKPMPYGELRFAATGSTTAPISLARVINGQYKADGRGGVPVGTYRVQVTRFAGEAPQAGAGPMLGHPPELPVPAKYSTDPKLEVKVESGSKEITKDFALTD